MGLPAKKASKLSIIRSPMARLVSFVALAMWGVTTTLSIVRSTSGTFGSSSNTSSAAPPRRPSWRAATSAGSSTIEPRATFTNTPDGPKASKTAVLMIRRVLADAAAQMTKTSDAAARVAGSG